MGAGIVSPFQKAVRLQLAAVAIAVLGFAGGSAALMLGQQNTAFAVWVGFLLPALVFVGWLPAGIACPKCGLSVIGAAVSAEEAARGLRFHFAVPSRRCRKCGDRLDS